MYQMPSEKLVQRMQQLVSNLHITPTGNQDSIALLKLEADSIMAELSKPVDKFKDWTMFDKQVILYAKDWYKETNSMDDIRGLLAKECSLEPKHVPDKEVLMQVALLVHKVWANKPADQWDMEVMYKDLWYGPFSWNIKSTVTMKDHLDALLRVLHHKTIEHFPELPKPSAEYFPLVDDKSLERWEKIRPGFEKALEDLTSGK